MKVLDIAGGTGDLARAFAKKAGASGEVWLTDINDSMLRVGRDRLTDKGLLVPTAVCDRSEEHTSELQSLMRISYAVFCLKKKIKKSATNVKDNNDHDTQKTSPYQI